MKKTIYQNLYMLKIFFRAAPGYSLFNMLFIILRSVLFNVFGTIKLTQYIVRTVGQMLSDSSVISVSLEKLFVIISIYYSLVLFFNTMIESVLNRYLLVDAEINVKKVFTKLLFEKSCEIDLRYYDNSDYYNNLIVANNESYTRAWSTYRNVVSLCENLIVLICLFYIVYCFDLIIFLFALIINILSAFCQIKLNKINGKVYNLSIPSNKKIDYVNRVFFMKKFSKDIKITSISNFLFEELKSSSLRLNNIYEEYGEKKALFSCLDGLVKRIMGDFCALIYLSYMFLVKGAYGFDVMTALWNAYGTMKSSMNNFVDSIKELHNNSIYIDKFINFMQLENLIYSRKGITTDISESVTIEFCNVTFSYNKKNNILNNLNLKIHANEKIAIVGNNGAGKSTIFKLLLRLYDPDKGVIFVNGIDIRDYDIDFYRKEMCSVLVQNYQLFAISLFENVAMDTVYNESDYNVINQAFQTVGLANKIGCFKNGGKSQYSKEFDDDGVALSGCERQKLVISRVLLNRGKMIMLDEPSSALDPKSESEFNDLIFSSIKEKTVIIISHRLSTTRMADRIILIDDGCVKEDGRHDLLMLNNGKYAEMFKIQAKRYE